MKKKTKDIHASAIPIDDERALEMSDNNDKH